MVLVTVKDRMQAGCIIEKPTLSNFMEIQVSLHSYILEPESRASLSCAHHMIQKLKYSKGKKVPFHSFIFSRYLVS